MKKIDIEYTDERNIVIYVGQSIYEAEVEHEVRVERFEVSFNGLNDEIEYEDHEFTHLRPHNLMHVEGRRNMTDDMLMQDIELIINITIK